MYSNFPVKKGSEYRLLNLLAVYTFNGYLHPHYACGQHQTIPHKFHLSLPTTPAEKHHYTDTLSTEPNYGPHHKTATKLSFKIHLKKHYITTYDIHNTSPNFSYRAISSFPVYPYIPIHPLLSPSCHVFPFLHPFSFPFFFPPVLILMCCPCHVFYPVSVILCHVLVFFYVFSCIFLLIYFLLCTMGPRI